MSNHPNNPYAAPSSASIQTNQPGNHGEPATLLSRFVGAIVDVILVVIVIVPISFTIGIVAGVLQIDFSTPLMSFLLTLFMLPIYLIVFLAINGYLLSTRGQTVGKYMVNTKIVGNDGTLQPLIPMFLKRYGVLWIFSMIPTLGAFVGIIDALMIFRGSRKCLHDEIAGTRVIKVQ